MNRGIVFEDYGDISKLAIAELPKPEAEIGKAVVKIHAWSLNPRDLSLIEGKFKFLTGKKFPKLIGADFCGQIVELPSEENDFKIGDQVLGYYENLKGGVSAQYCQIPLDILVPQPPDVKDEMAAALGCTYLTAYQALVEKAKLKEGQTVLIFGASGGVGIAAIQVAKKLGARVTAVSHSSNESYCLDQGADDFMAYDEEDVFQSSGTHDVFFQVFSDKGNFYSKGKKLVKRDGTYLSLIPNPLGALFGGLRKPKSNFILVKSNTEHLSILLEWMRSGELKPQLEQVYKMEDYATAFQQLENKKARGKIIISMPTAKVD